ncbi:hypothetical protein [Maribacter sp. Asnod1-A12]|uniref:hypothetical protein n=1 Tax=Maribacter sp. Asnod1-A12 TaxID=3160576 RepID=UPI00386E7B00
MRNRILITFSILIFILWGTSCRKNFEYTPSNGNLSFSKDTVYLDTVFANIGSSTYTLKVYNNTKDDITIPNISLRNGLESFYRLNVDGVAGKEFNNIPMYAKDSLFILIETTIDITNNSLNELLYTDAIQFDTEANKQTVELVTLAKDAIFLFPEGNDENSTENIILYNDESGLPITVEGFELNEEQLNFTNDKPIVVYGYAIVPTDSELIINAGSRLHFHQNSGMIIQDGATLTVNGELSENKELLESEVIFEGDRLEPEFEEIPGQWGALWISAGSKNNTINHLTLTNAEIGLYVEGKINEPENTLNISNSRIYNNLRHNLWTNNARIEASNIILGGSSNSSLFIENGGNYSFIHATITNYWNNGFRFYPAITMSNSSTTSNEIGFDLIKADFKNSIIDGNSSNELSLLSNNLNTFNFSFQNCFIKYNAVASSANDNSLYNFENLDHYSNILTNGVLDYYFPFQNDFRIGLDSEVVNKGDVNTANSSPLDIIGEYRIPLPDLGAFQAKGREF